MVVEGQTLVEVDPDLVELEFERYKTLQRARRKLRVALMWMRLGSKSGRPKLEVAAVGGVKAGEKSLDGSGQLETGVNLLESPVSTVEPPVVNQDERAISVERRFEQSQSSMRRFKIREETDAGGATPSLNMPPSPGQPQRAKPNASQRRFPNRSLSMSDVDDIIVSPTTAPDAAERQNKSYFSPQSHRKTATSSSGRKGLRRRGSVRNWMESFTSSDPRKQLANFFLDGDNRGPLGYLLEKGLPQAADPAAQSQHFAVYRPTSMDAIRMMMTGMATGKGLNVKGKSAKKGKLSGYVLDYIVWCESHTHAHTHTPHVRHHI